MIQHLRFMGHNPISSVTFKEEVCSMLEKVGAKRTLGDLCISRWDGIMWWFILIVNSMSDVRDTLLSRSLKAFPGRLTWEEGLLLEWATTFDNFRYTEVRGKAVLAPCLPRLLAGKCLYPVSVASLTPEAPSASMWTQDQQLSGNLLGLQCQKAIAETCTPRFLNWAAKISQSVWHTDSHCWDAQSLLCHTI